MNEIVALYIEIMTRWTEFCMPLIPYCQVVSALALSTTPIWVWFTLNQYRDEINDLLDRRKS